MVMTGHFDESGTHGGARVTTVAGFIAAAEPWAAYEQDLRTLNAEFGVNLFHAKDFRGRKGDFKNWLHVKRAHYNSRFLQMADAHLECGLATVVETNAYHAIYRNQKLPPKARPDTAYGLCFRAALWKSILYVAERPQDWPLNIVMESGHENFADVYRIFNEVQDQLMPKYEKILGFVSFASKKNCLPLAVADALAYAIFRMSSGLSQHPTNPNAAVVGPADPPYYVHKAQMSRTLIDEQALTILHNDLLAGGKKRLQYMPRGGSWM